MSGRRTAVALLGLMLMSPVATALSDRALAETGTSGWVQRTEPATVTRQRGGPEGGKRDPGSGERQPATVRRRAKSQTVPAPIADRPSTQLGTLKAPAKSTLGPIMAEPAGDDAAYIAYDQGQYLTALRLAKAAAERDEPQALTLLGRIYEQGLGVQRDPLTAAQLYRRGAELGDTESIFAFGVMLATGRGIQKNVAGAAQLFEQAARAGHAEANYNLGLLFIAGTGKPENPRRALMHIQYAAEKGLPAAQYDLAALYAKGQGTEPDAYQATRWLRAAAKSGMAVAEYDYAVQLLQGRGFNRDKPDIVDFLVSAARQGMSGAQNRLAHVFAEGQLVRKDMIEAAKWRLIAKASGRKAEDYDTSLDRLIAAMRARDLSTAQAAADGFIEGARVGDVVAAARRQ